MEQTILETLKGIDGTLKAKAHNVNLLFNFGGSAEVERGTFKLNIEFTSTFYETKHKDVIKLDDYDVFNSYDYSLNGLQIDNIVVFKDKLKSWGLNSICEKLTLKAQDELIIIGNILFNDESVKKMFSKNLKVWDILTKEEQMLLELKYIVSNFNESLIDEKIEVAKHYGIVGDNLTTSVKAFKVKLAELTK
jgi:hypothetical protein